MEVQGKVVHAFNGCSKCMEIFICDELVWWLLLLFRNFLLLSLLFIFIMNALLGLVLFSLRII